MFSCTQVSAAVEMMGRLKKDLKGKEKELNEHQRSESRRDVTNIAVFISNHLKKNIKKNSRPAGKKKPVTLFSLVLKSVQKWCVTSFFLLLDSIQKAACYFILFGPRAL